MASTLKKYQPNRRDLLINTDYGLPWKSMSAEEAKQEGFVLFQTRWVRPEEANVLSKQLRGYHSVTLVAVIYLFVGWSGAIGTIVNAVMSERVEESLIAGLPFLFLAVVMIAVGRGLLNYRSWAWGIATLCLVVTLTALALSLHGGRVGIAVALALFAVPHAFLFTSMVRNILVGKNPPSAETISPTENRIESSTTETVSAGPESNPQSEACVKKPAKTKINAKAVVQDISSGMDDNGLMEKYELSAKQLTVLYKKLEEAGLLGKARG